MRFDWYSASVPSQVSVLEDTINSTFGTQFLPGKPVPPYKTCDHHQGTDFRVHYDGCNPHPYFVATSAAAKDGARFLRENFPDHRVSRADVCIDLLEDDGFQRYVSEITPIARKRNVDCMMIGDPDPESTKGRTLYFGSAKSDIRLKVYEKGLEQIGKGNKTAPANWIRIELQARCRKERKTQAATLKPEDFFGFSGWTTTVAERVLGQITEYIPDPSLRLSDLDRKMGHMVKQYGATIQALCDRDGPQVTLARIYAATKPRGGSQGR